MAGVDEVGRGPLAGPVVAAAVILDEKRTIRGLNDSKLLTAEERERLDREIREARRLLQRRRGERRRDRHASTSCAPRCWRCGARSRACASSRRSSSSTATSGRSWRCRCARVVGGDAKVRAISAASIVAKVHRDRLLPAAARGASAVRLRQPQGLLDARAPQRAARARRLPAPPAQLRAGARSVLRPAVLSAAPWPAQASRRSRSRDNPLLARLRKLARRSGASYRKRRAVVLLEGEHLCAAWLRAAAAPALHAIVSEAAWDAAAPARSSPRRRGDGGGRRRRGHGRARARSSRRRRSPSSCRLPARGRDRRRARRRVVLDRLQDAGNVGSDPAQRRGLRLHARRSRSRARRRSGRPRCCAPAWARTSACAWSRAPTPTALDALDVAAVRHQLARRRSASHDAALALAVRLGVRPRRAGRRRRRWRRAAAAMLRIPQPGGEESLNVAAAAAICLYESTRRRP